MQLLSGVYLEITNKCNRCCPYCYNDSGARQQFLDKNLIFKVIDECRQNKIDQITVSGGEPFLHPDINEIIDYANANKISVKIISNLSLVTTTEVINFLNSGNFVQVTLDSTNKTKNDFTRGEGSYDSIIDLLEEAKDTCSSSIFLRMNLYKSNIEDIQNFIDFAIKYNIKHVAIAFLAKSGRGNDFPLIYDYNDSMLEMSKIVDDLKNKKEYYKNELDISYSNLEDQRGCAIFNVGDLNVVPRIDPFGDVFFCSYFFGSENILGNIHSNSLLKILNSKKMNDFINKIRKRRENEDCIKCAFNKICLCGCPAVSFMHSNNTQYKDDQCNLIKFFLKNKLKELSKEYSKNEHKD